MKHKNKKICPEKEQTFFAEKNRLRQVSFPQAVVEFYFKV